MEGLSAEELDLGGGDVFAVEGRLEIWEGDGPVLGLGHCFFFISGGNGTFGLVQVWMRLLCACMAVG